MVSIPTSALPVEPAVFARLLTAGTLALAVIGGGIAIFGTDLSPTSDTTHTTAPEDISTTLGNMSGDGTASNPYIITTDHELQAVAAAPSKHFELGSDIDLTGTRNWNDGAGFTPIGTNTNPFTGSFDGNGHTITALRINRPDEKRVGVFGTIDNATIHSVRLTDADVTGGTGTGSLVGDVHSGATITTAHVSASVTGTTTVGGVAGYIESNATLRVTSADTTVTGKKHLGGITGRTRGTVTGGEFITDVDGHDMEYIGGVTGYVNHGELHFNTLTSTLTTSGETIGGVVGLNDDGVIHGASVSSKILGGVAGINEAGGIAGSNNGTVTNMTVDAAVTANEVNMYDEQKHTGGVAALNYGTVSNVTASVDVSGRGSNTGGAIGTNLGTVRNVAVSGVVSGKKEFVGGVVGGNAESGVVRGVSSSATVTGDGWLTDTEHVGGAVGSNKGTIDDSTADGDVSGYKFVGGLAGSNYGVVENSSAASDLSVYDENNAGKLIGFDESRQSPVNTNGTGTIEYSGFL